MADATAALVAGRWQEARSAFALLAMTAGPVAQEGLAQAAWWLDDGTVAVDAREAAYRGLRAAGDDRGAALAAATLGYDSVLFGRGVAVGRGWLARAADLLGGRTDLPESGWLAVRQAEVALAVDHDAVTASEAATRAVTVGRSVGDVDLLSVGRALLGLARVRLGHVAEGMAELDFAAAAATAGDVKDLMWIGKIYCWLISACHETSDLARAGEWCARVAEFSERRQLAPLFAACRTQYASLLLERGDCVEAESTLADVLSRLHNSQRLGRLDAVAQLGELRRRQGRNAEAEALFKQVGFHPSARCGLALIRLAEGDVAHAQFIVTELLRALGPAQQLERGGVLPTAVRVAVASGKHAYARQAAEELVGIADVIGAEAFLGRAAAAEALVSDPVAAVGFWQDAARHFHEAALPFDEAECRVELAEVLSAEDYLSANEQAAAALDLLLPSLGNGQPAGRARAILRTSHNGPLTQRQIDVLRQVADGLSNAQIAEAMHLSEHTVHRHIANIYVALGLHSRAAAAAYAANQGLTKRP